jgi:hypothetical protein
MCDIIIIIIIIIIIGIVSAGQQVLYFWEGTVQPNLC